MSWRRSVGYLQQFSVVNGSKEFGTANKWNWGFRLGDRWCGVGVETIHWICTIVIIVSNGNHWQWLFLVLPRLHLQFLDKEPFLSHLPVSTAVKNLLLVVD